MREVRVVVVGDVLLDHDILGSSERRLPDGGGPVVVEDVRRDRPGGAGLAALLAAEDAAVTLVTALATDPPAERLRALLTPVVTLRQAARTGATVGRTRVMAAGVPVLRLDSGDWGPLTGDADDLLAPLLAGAGAVLVADHGGGLTALPGVRAALTRAAATVPVVWDPHPHGTTPVPGCALITPDLAGTRALAARVDAHPPTAAAVAAALTAHWSAGAVAVTLGARGALLATTGGPPTRLLAAPSPAGGTATSDPYGYGDRFAATAAVRLAAGDDVVTATTAAVEATTRFQRAGGAGRYGTTPPPAPAGGLDPARLPAPTGAPGSAPAPALAEGSPR
jgi:D-beta-D-heptose 7-phosphate kinase / D-beta-D-heptose 1-phosphate adenosyltransferase